MRNPGALFSKGANRLVIGGIIGFALGASAAVSGIQFSGISLSNATIRGQMAKMVGAFAGGGMIVVACVIEGVYRYFRFSERIETHRQLKFLEKVPERWEPDWDSGAVNPLDDERPLLESAIGEARPCR